jgi:hypothetical protein
MLGAVLRLLIAVALYLVVQTLYLQHCSGDVTPTVTWLIVVVCVQYLVYIHTSTAHHFTDCIVFNDGASVIVPLSLHICTSTSYVVRTACKQVDYSVRTGV